MVEREFLAIIVILHTCNQIHHKRSQSIAGKSDGPKQECVTSQRRKFVHTFQQQVPVLLQNTLAVNRYVDKNNYLT